jgi:kynureninase
MANKMYDRNYFEELDREDPLKDFYSKFDLPEGVIYLDGNSLGALPKGVAERVGEVVQNEWGKSLIKSWNVHDWYPQPSRVGDKIAKLIGADKGTVVSADSTSVNLFKLLTAAVRLNEKLNPGRRVILSDTGNFPNDLYVIQGLVDLLGGDYEMRLVAPEEIKEALTDDVAAAVITQVDYRTGRRHAMADLQSCANAAGIKVIWDLCHSAGAFSVDLAESGAELAVGCSYKYLNGGPGAPAYLYVAKTLQEDIRPPLSGWMGHTSPFDFDLEYKPADGVRRNLCGTPSVLGMSALEAALEVWEDVDFDLVRKKSQRMIDLFAELVEIMCPEAGFEKVTIYPEEQRGSQISLGHPEGYAIMQALIDQGVIGDFRAPNILRFGMTPLYVSYTEIYRAVKILSDIMATGSWDQPKFHARSAVT